MIVRPVEPFDRQRVRDVMVDWWGGRDLRNLVFPGLFTHFKQTSFIVEDGSGHLIAFLLGFLSQTFPDQAYINWVGVHPDHRNRGIARMLYERFYEVARTNGRNVITCSTSKVNQESLRWHIRMGFVVEEQESGYEFSKVI